MKQPKYNPKLIKSNVDERITWRIHHNGYCATQFDWTTQDDQPISLSEFTENIGLRQALREEGNQLFKENK